MRHQTTQETKTSNTIQLLLSAAKQGDVSHITQALQALPSNFPTTSWDCRLISSPTPLMEAAFNGQEAAVALLLEKGFAINGVDENGSTALFHAAVAGHASIITLLLRHGAKTQELNTYAISPLMAAVANGHTSAVEALLADKELQSSMALRRQFDLFGR